MKRLIINLNNVTAWFEDTEVKQVSVVTDGLISHHALPDHILLVQDGAVLLSYEPEIDSDELMRALPNLQKDSSSG